MRADYEKIRAENIARYGWDTAVLDLLGHLYSERTHFIFELIQTPKTREPPTWSSICSTIGLKFGMTAGRLTRRTFAVSAVSRRHRSPGT